MHDPYLYPDTRILKNLLGIMDDKKLQEAESDYVTLRLSEIAEDERLVGVFDFSALCRMHYRIFQDIYEWAKIIIQPTQTIQGYPLIPSIAITVMD